MIPYDLKVVNTEPTRGKNLIEFIITEGNYQIQSAHTFISEIETDYQAVGIITQVRITKKRKPIIKTFFDKLNYSIKDFESELKACDWNSVYEMESAEEMYSQFHSILSYIIQKHAPLVKKIVRNDKIKISFPNKKSIRDPFTNSESTKKNGVSLMILETQQSLTTTFSA